MGKNKITVCTEVRETPSVIMRLLVLSSAGLECEGLHILLV